MLGRKAVPFVFSVVILVGSSNSAGEQPGGYYFEVVAVAASNETRHDVNLKDQFDKEVVETWFEGPKMAAASVNPKGQQHAKQSGAFHNWYAITEPRTESTRVLVVRDVLHKNETKKVTIRRVAYLLLPAQRLTSGQPEPIPEDLDVYRAYEISNAPRVEHEVPVAGGLATPPLMARQPVFLCLPAEKWHHDEYVPITQTAQCLMVYRIAPQEVKKTITMLDSFGLHTLNASAVRWLAVPARIVQEDAPVRDE